MVKENGMVMMTEEEYRDLVGKAHQADYELDIAKTELATYRKAMKKLADKKLFKGKKKSKSYGIEIPAGDLVNLIDSMTEDWMDGDEEKFEQLDNTDFWFVWNGFSAIIIYGPWLCNEVLPAIKEAYDEYND